MMLISVSLNLLFLTLFIRSFSEFKNNKFVLPTYVTVVLIQWYLNQNGITFYGRWIILLLNLCYIMFMYKGKISKKLIYFIFVYFIFAISELVSVLLLEICTNRCTFIYIFNCDFNNTDYFVYNRIYIIKILS